MFFSSLNTNPIISNNHLEQIAGHRWLSNINKIDYAFQPIVNIHTGVCFGYEALLRDYVTAGFRSVDEFFDQAFSDNMLYHVEVMLRRKALEKFSKIPWNKQVKFFFNLDNRVLNTKDYMPGNTLALLGQHNLSQDTICFEISEKHELHNSNEAVEILNAYRSQGFKIAVDDCGTGFAGLKLLYHTRPDFIKIDRFFIQDITNDAGKRLFVSSILNLAHLMGSIVIAEGVETEQEYYCCRNIGCDMIQGYLIQYPEADISRLSQCYDHIRILSEKEQRKEKFGDESLIDLELDIVEPIMNYCNVHEAFERFKSRQDACIFPVINQNHEPLGVISEKSFKEYNYSRFGSELLRNPGIGKNLNKFILRYPIADIHTPVEKILEIYSSNEKMEGIIIADNMKYKGFLSAHSLLKILNEKNIATARDQNPLTRLPGNTVIHRYISEAIRETETQYIFVYFDIDNFKPFNDMYGFRQGDRVILLFSELLRTWTQYSNRFAGHMGGDDFFMGIQATSPVKVHSDVVNMANQFRNDVESFYDPDAREKRFIVAKDRKGLQCEFPLMTFSAVVMELPAKRKREYTTDEISRVMAKNKKIAKSSPEKLSLIRIEDTESNAPPPFQANVSSK